ncbi:MAG: hypothetical protein IIY95_00935, partial [Firmicutes bacterium]|nr:hypothetical protein [Bacillota bacterium]
MKKRSITVLLIVCLALLLAACTKAEETPAISDVGIIHEPEFGGVYVQNTIEEFNAKGFAYGDSVD